MQKSDAITIIDALEPIYGTPLCDVLRAIVGGFEEPAKETEPEEPSQPLAPPTDAPPPPYVDPRNLFTPVN